MAARRTKPHASNRAAQDPADPDNRRVQTVIWRFERVGWVALLLIAVAALAGLFGNGPFANAQATGPASVSVAYPRFVRLMSPAEIRVRLRADGTGGSTSITLGPALLDRFELSEVWPRPLHSAAAAQGMRLTFDVDATGRGAEIVLHVKAIRIGPASVPISIADAASLRLHTFVYP